MWKIREIQVPVPAASGTQPHAPVSVWPMGPRTALGSGARAGVELPRPEGRRLPSLLLTRTTVCTQPCVGGAQGCAFLTGPGDACARSERNGLQALKVRKADFHPSAGLGWEGRAPRPAHRRCCGCWAARPSCSAGCSAACHGPARCSGRTPHAAPHPRPWGPSSRLPGNRGTGMLFQTHLPNVWVEPAVPSAGQTHGHMHRRLWNQCPIPSTVSGRARRQNLDKAAHDQHQLPGGERLREGDRAGKGHSVKALPPARALKTW